MHHRLYLPKLAVIARRLVAGAPRPHLPETSWHQVARIARQAGGSDRVSRARTDVLLLWRGHARRDSGGYPSALHQTQVRGGARFFGRSPSRQPTRPLQETSETLFDVPLSLGTIATLAVEMGAALKAPHALKRWPPCVLRLSRTWMKRVGRKKGKLCWLWLAATATVAVFAIHAEAQQRRPAQPVGPGGRRHRVFGPLRRLQTRRGCGCANCAGRIWKRDFQKLKELGGEPRTKRDWRDCGQ